MQRIVGEPDIHIVRRTVGGEFNLCLVIHDTNAAAAGPNPATIFELGRLFVFKWPPVIEGVGRIVCQLNAACPGLICSEGCIRPGAFAASEEKRRNRDQDTFHGSRYCSACAQTCNLRDGVMIGRVSSVQVIAKIHFREEGRSFAPCSPSTTLPDPLPHFMAEREMIASGFSERLSKTRGFVESAYHVEGVRAVAWTVSLRHCRAY
jgi:hypothetical protein